MLGPGQARYWAVQLGDISDLSSFRFRSGFNHSTSDNLGHSGSGRVQVVPLRIVSGFGYLDFVQVKFQSQFATYTSI
jgi:hypothetical protein